MQSCPVPIESQLRDHGLLAQLTGKDRRRIAKKLQLVSLGPEEMLFETSGAIRHVFFPLSAVLSVSGTTSEGDAVEINHIGSEGIAGVEVALRTQFRDQPIASTVVHRAGTALRMKAEHFAEEVDQYPRMNRCVCRYMGFCFSQLQLYIACNRHHSLEQRCARRLLTAQDLGETEEVQITQQQLSQMLGVTRQSVDRVLHALEEQQIVELSRGLVRIHNRQGLKVVSCACYRLLKRERHELLAWS